MKPGNNKIINYLIATLSVTSLVGLINLFGSRDAKNAQIAADDSSLNQLLDAPMPTLVPSSAASQPAAVPSLEVVSAVPTPMPAAQAPVVEKVTVGNSSGGSSSRTASSR